MCISKNNTKVNICKCGWVMAMRDVRKDDDPQPLVDDFKQDNWPIHHYICGNPDCKDKQEIVSINLDI